MTESLPATFVVQEWREFRPRSAARTTRPPQLRPAPERNIVQSVKSDTDDNGGHGCNGGALREGERRPRINTSDRERCSTKCSRYKIKTHIFKIF